MAKVKKTFRIEEDAYGELVELADGWGVSQGAAVERAIRDARRSPDTCQTAGAGVEAAIAALTGQLAAKDEQIAALGRALAAAHETAKAAQVLHAQERRAIESADQKRGRLARALAALRG